MACELTTERANPLRQWNPGWGGCSSARRPVAAVNKLFLRRSVFVKRFTHEMTLREAPAVGADDQERCSPPTFDREPSPDARPESATDRMRGDGRPSQNALPPKIFRRPQPPERRRTERRPKLAPPETHTRQGGPGARALAMASARNSAARHAYPGMGTRSGRSSPDVGTPAIPPGRAPSDRRRRRPPGSALSRRVPARLTCPAAAYRTAPHFEGVGVICLRVCADLRKSA